MEVLVALLILTVGLVGMAFMQMRALQAAQSASDRSTAMLITYTVATALQMDRPGASKGDYNGTYTASTTPAANANSLAATIKSGWRASLSQISEAATLTVQCNGQFKPCTVALDWDETRTHNSNTPVEHTRFNIEVPI